MNLSIENADIDMNLVYEHFKSKSTRNILKRSLTELSQKYTLDCTRSMSMKFTKDKQFYCPCHLHEGDRFYTTNSKGKKIKVKLQRAHVGITRSHVINNVLDEYPDQTDIVFLLDKVMLKHKNIKLQIACQSCNKKLE